MNLAERIDDFLEERANAEIDWDDQVSAFRDFVEMELQEQREECADAVIAELKSMGFQIYQIGEDRIRDACLGATGESDDK